PLGDLTGFQRSGDLVVVGYGDRPESLLLGGLEQQFRGRRAIRRVVRVHVQVAVDVVPVSETCPDLGISLRVLAPPGQSAVDGFDLVGHLDPRPRLAGAPRGDPEPLAQRRVAAESLQLGAQGEHVTEREEQAAFALSYELAVELQVGDDGDGAGCERLSDHAGGRADAAGGQTSDVRSRKELGGLAILRPHDAEAIAQAPADARKRIGGPVEPDNALPVEVLGELAKGSQQEAQGAALLLRAVHDPQPSGWRGLEDRLGDVGPGSHELVLAGEEALQELPCGLVAGQTLVDPTEEDLDQHPGHLSGEHPLDRLMEGRHVEGLRVPQRCRPGARGERLMDVEQVDRDGAQQALQRTADVERQWRRAPPRTARQGDALADREHAGVFTLQHRRRIRAGLADQPPALPDRGPGLRRGDDQDSVATLGKLFRGPPDELVDLVPRPPWMGADLRDREGLPAHAAELTGARSGPRSGACCRRRPSTSPWPWPSWSWPGPRADTRR